MLVNLKIAMRLFIMYYFEGSTGTLLVGNYVMNCLEGADYYIPSKARSDKFIARRS